MKDEQLANEEYLASVREDFDQALVEADWDVARTILEALEEMKIDTYVLRREMNIAMIDDRELEEIADEPYQNLQRDNA